jgi:GH24 family phage-related lysozyme (muramidase)
MTALVSLAYNNGLHALEKSILLKRLNNGENPN